MKEQRLMAFWRYDIFPKVMLNAEVVEFHEGGYVSVKGYQGMRFIPIAVVPYEQGLEYSEEFEELKKEYNETVKLARTNFLHDLHESIPFTKEIK